MILKDKGVNKWKRMNETAPEPAILSKSTPAVVLLKKWFDARSNVEPILKRGINIRIVEGLIPAGAINRINTKVAITGLLPDTEDVWKNAVCVYPETSNIERIISDALRETGRSEEPLEMFVFNIDKGLLDYVNETYMSLDDGAEIAFSFLDKYILEKIKTVSENNGFNEFVQNVSLE